MKENRLAEMDMARGILILFVVLLHFGVDCPDFVYFMPIPGFLFIGGYFFMIKGRIKNYTSFLVKKASNLMIPYVAYTLLFLLTAICFLIKENTILHDIAIFVTNTLYGGRKLGFIFTALWYIPVYFFVVIFVGWLVLKYSENKVLLICCIMYFAGCLESVLFSVSGKSIDFPLNIDVVLVSCIYFVLGYLYRLYRDKLINPTFKIIIALAAINIILLDLFGVAKGAEFDMMHSKYTNSVYYLIAPLSMILFIIFICEYLSVVKPIKQLLAMIGRNTLTILYLHNFLGILVSYIFKGNMEKYGLIFTVIVCAISVAVGTLMKFNRITSMVFLGTGKDKELSKHTSATELSV